MEKIKIEVRDQSIFKKGCMVGISSRGVAPLTKLKGVKIVEAGRTADGVVWPASVLREFYHNFSPMMGQFGTPWPTGVKFSESSHIIDQLFYGAYSNSLYADIRVLHTPNGQKLDKILSDKMKVYFLPHCLDYNQQWMGAHWEVEDNTCELTSINAYVRY